MIEFAFPFSTGEWLAWCVAVLTMVIGLIVLVLPRRLGVVFGLRPTDGSNNGLSELRGALGGVWLGLGLACILLAQPLVYLALGLAFFGAVLGRIVSFFADGTFNLRCIGPTIFEALCAFFPIAYALQIIA